MPVPTSPPLSLLDTSGLNRSRAQSLVSDVLRDADDGELFLERRQSESLVYDDGKLKAASCRPTACGPGRGTPGPHC